MSADFSADAFDPKNPAAFYLPKDGRAELEALSDVTLVVDGERLPVHCSVLSLQSRVLRGCFSDLKSGSTGAGSVGCKRNMNEPDATLFDASLFLRLCYCPTECTPANLAAVLSSLPGLLCLAHKLDAPQIQQAVCECMADQVQSAPLADLVGWVAAADCCQLHELRLRCISEVVRRLASRQGGLSGAFADAALMVGHLDKSVLAQLLGLVLAAGGEQVASNLAAPSAAVEALDQAANPGSFEWELERYSQQPGGVGRKAESPWFSVAGREWCLRVYPGGYTEETAGHLSAFLWCKQGGTRARFYITLVDQAAAPGAPVGSIGSPSNLFSTGWGYPKLASHEKLRSHPGYLAGDRLVLRVSIEVVL